jgi:hypothetical protein
VGENHSRLFLLMPNFWLHFSFPLFPKDHTNVKCKKKIHFIYLKYKRAKREHGAQGFAHRVSLKNRVGQHKTQSSTAALMCMLHAVPAI